jgi:hypothetical protein
MQIVMAGFDKVDPAMLCFFVASCAGDIQITVERASGPVERRRAIRTRDLPWSENTPCADESARRAGYVC